jgi:hypothetical protein
VGKRQLSYGSPFWYQKVMTPASSDIKSPKRPGQSGTPIMLRLQPDDLELLDLWIAANAPEASRPEAMRRILRLVAMRVRKA